MESDEQALAAVKLHGFGVNKAHGLYETGAKKADGSGGARKSIREQNVNWLSRSLRTVGRQVGVYADEADRRAALEQAVGDASELTAADDVELARLRTIHDASARWSIADFQVGDQIWCAMDYYWRRVTGADGAGDGVGADLPGPGRGGGAPTPTLRRTRSTSTESRGPLAVFLM